MNNVALDGGFLMLRIGFRNLEEASWSRHDVYVERVSEMVIKRFWYMSKISSCKWIA